MKKLFLSVAAAAFLLGPPAAQAAFVSPSVVVTATHASGTTAEANVPAVVEATATPTATVKAKKLSFFGKLKRYFSGSKSQIVATILVLLFGNLGVHRFYLGYTGIGLAQLGLTLAGYGVYIAGVIATATALSAAAIGTTVAVSPLVFVGGALVAVAYLWVLIDLIRILIGKLQPKGGYYDKTF